MAVSIKIAAGANEASSSVAPFGSEQHLITERERSAFKIDDQALKKAAAKFVGRSPDKIFVHSPAGENDRYKKNGWPELQTLLTVKSAKIVRMESRPSVVDKQIFVNDSGKRGTFHCGVMEQVATTAESNWSSTSSVEIGQSISYSVSFLGTGVEGETALTFNTTWGKGGSVSETLTLGTESAVDVELEPGESVIAELTASKGTLTVEVTYQLTLAGFVVGEYAVPHKKARFWGMEINSLLSAAKLPTSITATEKIKIGFYADSRIVLTDAAGAVMDDFVAGAVPVL